MKPQTIWIWFILSATAQGAAIPQLNGISPAEPAASIAGTPIMLTVSGSGFQAGLTVFAIDPTSVSLPLGTPSTVTSTSFAIPIALTKTGDWQLFVINPGAIVSNHFVFQVDCDPSRVRTQSAPACGQPLGVLAEYQNQPALSNGCYQWTPESCANTGTYGNQYQCVEFVKRALATLTPKPLQGDPVVIWANYADFGLTQYNNGGVDPPKVGDMVVWGTTPRDPHGHIAIVTAVSPADVPTAITVAEQNYSITGTTTISLQSAGGNYSLSPRIVHPVNGGAAVVRQVLGWLRVGYSISIVNTLFIVDPKQTGAIPGYPAGVVRSPDGSIECDVPAADVSSGTQPRLYPVQVFSKCNATFPAGSTVTLNFTLLSYPFGSYPQDRNCPRGFNWDSVDPVTGTLLKEIPNSTSSVFVTMNANKKIYLSERCGL